MTFLNATLLFAVAAIAVPVVLHLISKREPKRVVFPSVRFLTKTFESSRAKLRVRRWWLLALRMAALAALALALARPAIHQSLSMTWLTIGLIGAVGLALLVMATAAIFKGQSKGLTYGLGAAAAVACLAALSWAGYTFASGKRPQIDTVAPAAVAILIDNSATMAWKTSEDDRQQRAKDIAKWMITQLPPTSRVAIVDRSSTPVTFALDVGSAISKIDQIEPISVTQPIASRIDAAMRLVRTSDLENRKLLVLTDLTTPTWESGLIDPQLPATFGEDPKVNATVFDLGEFQGLNRSLSLPRLSDATPPKGVSVPITTTLQLPQSTDDQPISTILELELYENDPALPVVRDGVVQRPATRSVNRTSTEITAGESREILLTTPPLEVGVHHGLIRMVGEDAMPLDDVRYFTIEVLPASRILLVGDNRDEASVFSAAITAPFPVDDPRVEYAIERVAYDDLQAVQLRDFEAVLLLDPPVSGLSDERLIDFVNDGGQTFVCLGRQAGDETIELPHLPKLVRRWRVPKPFTFFSPLQTSHPMLAPLSEISGGVPWGDYRVEQYWQAETTESDSVLIRYAGTKHAALLQRRGNAADAASQRGAWTIMTTPLPDLANPQHSWNDLFGSDAWPAFLLVRQICKTVTGRNANVGTSMVGQPRVVGLPPIDASTEDMTVAQSRRLQLFPPGDAMPVPMDVAFSSRDAAVSDVSRAGTYWIRGAGSPLGFSTNVSPESTVTDRVEVAELDQWFGPEAYSVVTDKDDIELANSEWAQRVSLHSPVMLIALAVFLMELILSNRFYQSKNMPSNSAARPAVSA